MTLRPGLLRVQLALVLLLPAVLPLAARADVHTIEINEYYTQCDNGSGEVQYIELRPLTASQFFRQCASIEYRRTVGGPTRFFAKPVFVGHGNAEGFPTQKRFLIATSSFQGIVGFAPDLVMPDGTMDPQGGVIRFAADSGCSFNWGTIHEVVYGDQGPFLAPGPNEAANRSSKMLFLAGTPTPKNFAGNTSSSWTCIDLSCFLLSLSHSGSGSDPVALPGSSSACSSGQYHAGENISLTAIASSGWEVGSWSGTSNDSSTSTSNSLVMPASSHSASVNYLQIPCYLLSLSHSGSGSDPVALPGSSSACSSGQYHAGENISLTAIASSGWKVGSWTGTSDDASTSTSNSLVMPASAHSVAVNYIPCVIPNDLVLSDDTLSTPTLYEACDSITLGPNLFITAGGTGVIVRAPVITFVDRVEVLTGGVASFGGQ